MNAPLLLLIVGCSPGRGPSPGKAADTADTANPSGAGSPPDSGAEETGSPGETADSAEDPGETAEPAPPRCPAGMVPIPEEKAPLYCIDAYEATASGDLGNADQGAGFPDGSTTAMTEAIAGVIPKTGITWYQAFAVCFASGRRLCSYEEWRDACDGDQGEGGSTFPWGESPEPTDVCALLEGGYGALQPTGSLPECATPTGIYDQMGNAWEWVDPGQAQPDGVPVTGKVGGAFYAGTGQAICDAPAFTDHPPDFEGTIGFRCCADPQ